MRKLRNFKCETGAIIERLVNDDINKSTCECGGDAEKTISTPRYLGNSTGKSPARK